MSVKSILSASLLLISSHFAFAQKASDVEAYISKYKQLAIEEQKRTGVPAAIKLAQGIHESGCGNSELSQNANNHFGIKCKSNWTGATYTYTDDAKDECFRKYEDDKGSFKDHSDFLKNSTRYAKLFDLEVTDYKGWANGLKKCGYATNPKYAGRIIDLIEKYDLDQYSVINNDNNFGDAEDVIIAEVTNEATTLSPTPQTLFAQNEVPQTGEVSREYYSLTVKNGLKGFYAKKGDLLLNAAYMHKIRYAKLLSLNDLIDEPLPEDMFIYLEKKHKEGNTSTYEVKDGDQLITIAQEQGMRLKELKQYNHLSGNEEPALGVVLNLKNTAAKKPLLRAPIFGNNPNPDFVPKRQGDNYIDGGAKTQPAQTNNNTNQNIARENEIPARVVATSPKVEEKIEVQETEAEYNIANETAVEDAIAAEKNTTPATETTSEPTEPLSELDRLKAKLDRSVYGTNTGSNKNNASSSNRNTPSNNTPKVTTNYETRPASSNTTSKAPEPTPAVNNNQNNRRSTTTSATTGGGQDALKRRIEANQQEERANPVVANKSNAATIRPEQARVAPIENAKASPKASPKKTATPTEHSVKKGETATAIAAKYNISVKELIKLNKLPANGSVKLGQKLKVK